jgi:hypothetical protein
MVDLRNLFDEGDVRENGFRHYARVGRKPGSAHKLPLPSRAARAVPRQLRKTIEPASQAVATDLAIGG